MVTKQIQRPTTRRPSAPTIDTRTPSGKRLPY